MITTHSLKGNGDINKMNVSVNKSLNISLGDDCSVSSSELESLIKLYLLIESKEERAIALGFLAGLASSNEKTDIKLLATISSIPVTI